MVEAMREIEKHLAILEKYLQGKTFLVAEQFSLADKCSCGKEHVPPRDRMHLVSAVEGLAWRGPPEV